MNWEEIKHKFPACMHTIKMPDISKFKLEEIVVYRACIDNNINSKAFLPTYLDSLQNRMYQEDDPRLKSPSFFSLSVFSDEKEAIQIMKFLSNKKARPFALGKGKTNFAQGIWERTCEWDKSKTSKQSSHYDYWLYEKNDVYKDFSMYIIE